MNNSNDVSTGKKSNWLLWTIILAFVLLVIILCCVFTVQYSLTSGVSESINSFHDTFINTQADTYDTYHDIAFSIAESSHHIHNDVIINIIDVKKEPKLEALRVSDIVYICTDKGETASKTQSWIKVYGSGVFTVNLNAAEFVTDASRQHILIRVPKPILTSDNIKIDSYENLLFSENTWNRDNSVHSGRSLAQDQLREAMQRMQDDYRANEQYSKMAETSAKSMLSAIIKSLNPDIANLQVDVEYF